MMLKNYNRLTVVMDIDLRMRLRRYAEATFRSESALTREAITALLDKLELDTSKEEHVE